MKKLFIIIAIFIVGNIAFAQNEKQISFIYINGSNNNDAKMKEWFFDGVNKLHPEMRKQFLESQFSQKYFLLDNTYTINEKPLTFFWGDMSAEEIQRLDEGLNITKVISPKLAQVVRTVFAHCMHDAIWVEKYHNMRPLVKKLHKTVMSEYQKGNQVVLFGYSAGSFITYQYLFNKLPDIELSEFFDKTILTQDEKNFVKANPMNNSCIDAIVDSRIAVFSMDGHLIPNINPTLFKANYKHINEYTEKSCIPEGAVKGIVNFASPLVLFYSDVTDPKYEMNYYNKLLYEYLIEHDMFWLTTNYSEDPLGFPTTTNYSTDQIEAFIHREINPRKGLIYDKSDFKSRKTFIGAHTSYWSTARHFAKEVAIAYQEGYEKYYPEKKLTTSINKTKKKAK